MASNPNTALAAAKPQTAIVILRDLLERSKEQIALALPKHMSVERLVRVAITSVQKTPKLMECTPLSIVGCVMEAAQLGLEPDGILGDAYLVPYWNKKTGKNEAQLQPGYRGLINLARRSGQVSWIASEPVYECDKFSVKLGDERKIIHEPDFDNEDRGVVDAQTGIPVGLRGVYAMVKFKDGETDFEYMPLHQILMVRAGSKSKDNGPWVTHFEQMARKTPIRRLAKRLPLSPEFQKAAILDEYVDAGVAPSQAFNVDPSSETARLASEAAMDSLKDKYVRQEDVSQDEGPTQEENPQSAPAQTQAQEQVPQAEQFNAEEAAHRIVNHQRSQHSNRSGRPAHSQPEVQRSFSNKPGDEPGS